MAASSAEYVKAALDTYHTGRTVRCALLVGVTVPPGSAGYLIDLAPDLASAAAVPVTVGTLINAAAAPKRTEVHFGDATFPSVDASVGDILRVAYYVDTGTAATSPLIHHGGLSEPLTPNGSDIIIRQGSDGVVHAEIVVPA
jgi:hypothetical protein